MKRKLREEEERKKREFEEKQDRTAELSFLPPHLDKSEGNKFDTGKGSESEGRRQTVGTSSEG